MIYIIIFDQSQYEVNCLNKIDLQLFQILWIKVTNIWLTCVSIDSLTFSRSPFFTAQLRSPILLIKTQRSAKQFAFLNQKDSF
jgi:hypothetical protein